MLVRERQSGRQTDETSIVETRFSSGLCQTIKIKLMRDKILTAVMQRYGSLATLKMAMWEDEDVVLVNLCDDLNDEFTEDQVLTTIKTLLR